MTLHLKMPSKVNNLSPKISVIGVGGTGGNIINSMIESAIEGVHFLNVNTDSQALKHSLAQDTLQLGPNCTQGLGAGANPDIGKQAAEEVTNEIQDYIENSNMIFITAGMGGGTGTGASPVIAKIARDLGILIVGVVTKPFEMEGKRRMNQANEGIKELQKYVDNLIVIPNQNIYHFAKPDTTISEALQLADNVLINGVKSIIDLMVKPGIMNHDFADVKAVMSETGKVHMGTGISDEQDRAMKATEEAICNPLLENNSMSGARGILINITGGKDVTLHEVDQAVNRIKEESNENANLIWGLTEDEELNGRFKISVISTGIDSESYIENQIENVNITELRKEYTHEDSIQNYPSDILNEEIKEEKNEVKVKENSINTQTSLRPESSFIVNLNNDFDETNSNKLQNNDNSIKELEEKARKFKVSEKNEVKSSIFSKLFGKKQEIQENEIEEIKEQNLSLSHESKDIPELKEKNNTDKNYNDETSIELNNKESVEIKNNSQKSKEQQDLEFEEELLQIPAFLRRQAN